MTDLLFPAALAGGAVTVTYLTCVRPALRGRGCTSATDPRAEPAGRDLDAELRRARAQLAALAASSTDGRDVRSDDGAVTGKPHP